MEDFTTPLAVLLNSNYWEFWYLSHDSRLKNQNLIDPSQGLSIPKSKWSKLDYIRYLTTQSLDGNVNFHIQYLSKWTALTSSYSWNGPNTIIFAKGADVLSQSHQTSF